MKSERKKRDANKKSCNNNIYMKQRHAHTHTHRQSGGQAIDFIVSSTNWERSIDQKNAQQTTVYYYANIFEREN